MNEVLQGSYKALLNLIYDKKIKKISVKTRNNLVTIICFILAFYFVFLRTNRFYQLLLREQDICHFFGACLLFLIAVFSMHGEVEIVPWRKSLAIPYCLLALGIVGIGLMHPIGAGYGFFGLMLLTVYPCLYIVWNNRGDYEGLFDKLTMAFMTAGIAFFVWFAFVDYRNIEELESGRHTGGLYNANFVSFIGISLSCTALYFLYRCFEKKLKGNVSAVSAAFGVIAVLMGAILIIKGESRSAELILIANLFVCLYFMTKERSFIGKTNNKKIVIASLIIVAVALLVALKLNMLNLDRFDFSNQDANQYTSGRMEIWKSYYQQLTLLGHDMSAVDWEALTVGIDTRHAHNNFLDYSYRCGVPVGLCCITLQLVAGIIVLIRMFGKERNKSYEVFVTIFTVHYLVLSLIDIATLPMTNYGAFFFYICLAPLMVNPENSID